MAKILINPVLYRFYKTSLHPGLVVQKRISKCRNTEIEVASAIILHLTQLLYIRNNIQTPLFLINKFQTPQEI